MMKRLYSTDMRFEAQDDKMTLNAYVTGDSLDIAIDDGDEIMELMLNKNQCLALKDFIEKVYKNV